MTIFDVLANTWNKLCSDFYDNFIDGDGWLMLLRGLGVTMEITVFALLIGIVIGFLVAIIRSTHDKTGHMRFGNWLCNLYLTVIRGTPVLVQLLIIYFVIFGSFDIDKVLAAVLTFGINSGAYVAEIVRGGIMAVDNGQFEAGRSLGFSYGQTMRYIVGPQAFKTVLPALANEMIALLKETSVAGYIALNDLTRAGYVIRSKTFSAYMPLLAVAAVYLIAVLILTKLIGILERRLRADER